jgi:acetylglutamate/LysW-gamma-L-alpha-aminoadipate kinase
MTFTGVLKLGGGAGVQHAAALANLAARVAAGERWVLVHGASDAANRLAAERGVPVRTLTTSSGHSSRYTDPETLAIFCEAAAQVNAEMLAGLMARGCLAVGFANAEIIRAERKAALRAMVNGRQVIIRDDYSGSITGVDSALLYDTLEEGWTPVIAPIASGGELRRLNVDGDRAAAAIARALGADALVILSNVPGLLRDVDDPTSLIPSFDLNEIAHYETYAAGRMKKKLLAAREALVERTILADSRVARPLDAALTGAGTHIHYSGQLMLAGAAD